MQGVERARKRFQIILPLCRILYIIIVCPLIDVPRWDPSPSRTIFAHQAQSQKNSNLLFFNQPTPHNDRGSWRTTSHGPQDANSVAVKTTSGWLTEAFQHRTSKSKSVNNAHRNQDLREDAGPTHIGCTTYPIRSYLTAFQTGIGIFFDRTSFRTQPSAEQITKREYGSKCCTSTVFGAESDTILAVIKTSYRRLSPFPPKNTLFRPARSLYSPRPTSPRESGGQEDNTMRNPSQQCNFRLTKAGIPRQTH